MLSAVFPFVLQTYLVYMKDGEGNSLNEMFGAVGVVKKSQVCTNQFNV